MVGGGSGQRLVPRRGLIKEVCMLRRTGAGPLTVGERSYKCGKGENQNEPCGLGSELKILV